MKIYTYAWTESAHPDSLPGYYQRRYQGEFYRSYTFKMDSYRDLTVIFLSEKHMRMYKVVEPGWDENFHTWDVEFKRKVTGLSHKMNATSSSALRKLSIQTKD